MINKQIMTSKHIVNTSGAVPDGYQVNISDERFVLMPESAVWWPAKHLLMVADIHFGKDAHLQRSGIAVPAIADQEGLLKLTLILQKTKATTLVILGDLFHARLSGEEISVRCWTQFCKQFPKLEIVAVEGNHDRNSAVNQLPLNWHNHYRINQFEFRHEPPDEASPEHDLLADNKHKNQQLTSNKLTGKKALDHKFADNNSHFTFCGHLHPSYRLQSGRRESVRLPVFWLRPKTCVLPAFGLLTGGMDINPAEGDRVAGVTPEGVFPLLGL